MFAMCLPRVCHVFVTCLPRVPRGGSGTEIGGAQWSRRAALAGHRYEPFPKTEGQKNVKILFKPLKKS